MKFARLLVVPFAFAFVLAIRFISRWRLVRFGDLYVNRLGHLVGNTESYLCERDAGMHDAIDIWVPVDKQVCSKVILKKYKRRLHTLPYWFGSVVLTVNRLFQGWEKHYVCPTQNDRDVHNLWKNYAPHIEFTPAEERRGERLLRHLGIPKGAKWVCLFVRDSAYLKAKAPNVDWSYHDFRDSDIAQCTPAVVKLAQRGYYVVRVGDVVARPFNVKHSHVIDYALSKYKSDFGHLYLGAKCEFVLGSSSGFMAIAQAFNRPVCVINYAPLEYMLTYCKGLTIWKHHIKDGRRMTPAEIYASGLGLCTFGQVFTQAGITFEDNSAQEIYEVSMEMADYVEGKTEPDEQKAFWEAHPRSICPMTGRKLHGEIEMRIGREFLKGYE